MDITLKVQPEVLTTKADEIAVEKNTIVGLMDQVKSEIGSLAGTWTSNASEEFQAKFKQLYDDMDNVFVILTEYINDLKQAAEVYVEGEQKVRNVVDSLPIDGVFKS